MEDVDGRAMFTKALSFGKEKAMRIGTMAGGIVANTTYAYDEAGQVLHIVHYGPGDVIQHVWFHEGQRATLAPLTLGGSHWRTYSRRILDPGLTGRWVVEARHPDGEVLARQEFLCVPAEL